MHPTATKLEPARFTAAGVVYADRLLSAHVRKFIYPLHLLLVTLASTILAFLRLSSVSRDTMWAEDGTLFIEDAIEHGPLYVFTPYAGYLHFVPRTMAQLVVTLGQPDQYAVWVSVASCLVLGAIAALTYHCSHVLTQSTTLRLAFASIPVLVAPGAFETAGNLANLHWYLIWLTPWLLLKPAASKIEGTVLFAAAACASLTEILALLFVPLLLLNFRSRRHLPAAVGLTIGGAAQLFATLSNPRADDYDYALNWLSVPYGYVLNSSASLVYGTSAQISGVITEFGPWPVIGAFVLLSLPVAAVMLVGNPGHRLTALVFCGASILVWAAAQIVNPTPLLDYAEFNSSAWLLNFALTRYTTVPAMFLLACIPLAISAFENVALLQARRAKAALLGVFVVLQLIHFFPPESTRANGPEWSTQFENARTLCNGGAETVEIASAPDLWDPVELTCPLK